MTLTVFLQHEPDDHSNDDSKDQQPQRDEEGHQVPGGATAGEGEGKERKRFKKKKKLLLVYYFLRTSVFIYSKTHLEIFPDSIVVVGDKHVATGLKTGQSLF